MTDSKNPQPEASAATEAAPQQAAQAEAAGKPARRTTARRTARKTAEKTVEKSVEKAGAPVAPKIVDVDDPSLYINREISWIGIRPQGARDGRRSDGAAVAARSVPRNLLQQPR